MAANAFAGSLDMQTENTSYVSDENRDMNLHRTAKMSDISGTGEVK